MADIPSAAQEGLWTVAEMSELQDALKMGRRAHGLTARNELINFKVTRPWRPQMEVIGTASPKDLR